MDDAESSADDIRARCRAQRRGLPSEHRRHASAEVARRVGAVVADRRPGRVGTYLATDGEIETGAATATLRSLGWQIHLPIIGDARSMVFAEWNVDTVLHTNRFGIDEPAEPFESVAPDQLDLVLVPCVAADTNGNRLGFGAGYYDRAFAGQPESGGTRPTLVGLLFDVQLVRRVPAEPWDVPLDIILTESMTVTTGSF